MMPDESLWHCPTCARTLADRNQTHYDVGSQLHLGRDNTRGSRATR